MYVAYTDPLPSCNGLSEQGKFDASLDMQTVKK